MFFSRHMHFYFFAQYNCTRKQQLRKWVIETSDEFEGEDQFEVLFVPLYPGGQSHVNPISFLRQVAPFWHLLSKQSLYTTTSGSSACSWLSEIALEPVNGEV